jgi:hypothetical protein
MVQRVPDRNGGNYRLPDHHWHFSREELTPPAFFGEHNRAGLAEL